MLKKCLKVIPGAVLALLLVGCSADGEVVGGGGDVPVAFSAYTSGSVGGGEKGSLATRAGAGPLATRAVGASPDSVRKSIGVFAFYQEAKSNGYPNYFNKYTGDPNYYTPNFMYNQELVYDSSSTSWSYSPKKYWPNNENDLVSFFAYSPYSSSTSWDDLRILTNLKGDEVFHHYTMSTNVDSLQDYVWADPILNQLKPAAASSQIQFNFKHICSRLGATCIINVYDSTAYLSIDTVRFTGKFNVSGDYVYLPNSSQSEWRDTVASSSDITFTTFKGEHPITTDTTYVGGNSSFAFVMPGTQDITFSFVITQRNNQGSKFSGTITKTFSGLQLDEGKAYDFLIKVTLTPIEIGTVSVRDISLDIEYHNIP